MDAAVENYSSLVAGVLPGFEAIILDSTQDGVQQITQVLSQRQNLASVHIVSHGSCGSVQLGTANLSWNTLSFYANQLQSWQNALTDTAQILLYGCNVAAGAVGKAFVQRLSELTSALVAASDDLTGNAALGGDWELEVQTGCDAVTLAFSQLSMETYQGVLNSQPYLVADINPGTGSSNPWNVKNFNGTLYFTAYDPAYGREIWKLDKTTGQPVRLTDINPGTGSSDPGYLNNINGTLYFVAYDSTYGRQFWKLDSTTDQPVRLTNINKTTTDWTSYGYGFQINGNLYFIVYNLTQSKEQLWKFDETAGDIVQIISDMDEIIDIFNFNNTLYLSFKSSTYTGLVKIDNTDNVVRVLGTTHDKDYSIYPPYFLTEANGTLYFIVTVYFINPGLWKIDNNTGNAVLVDDRGGSHLASFNDTLYFLGDESDLWWIDKTTGNLVQHRDIYPDSQLFNPGALNNVNGTLYFFAYNSVNQDGLEFLWKIDNATGKAVRLADIYPELELLTIYYYYPLTEINGTLYFVAYSATNGQELWKIDYTTGKPTRITDINPGTGSSSPYLLTYLNGTLYFSAYNPTTGRELWALPLSDGSNSLPIATDDSFTTNQNTSIIISAATLLANDTDADGDPLSVTPIIQPSHGSLIDNNDGTYTYTPNQNYYGTDSFTYSISDGRGGSSTAIVNLTIKKTITGTSASETINGTAEAEIIYGLDGNDTLYGGLGNDTLYGGAGNDWLDGGAGADVMIGGSGNDIYFVDNPQDTIIEEANGGTDTVISTISWQLGEHLENLTLTGSNAINGTGNSGNNVIIGNSAANVLSGGDGNDWLSGGAGNDTLYGGTGNDTLYGDAGNDILYGDAGNDSLFGGAGNDTLYGGAGNDWLDGGAGADVMVGGSGNNIYFVDNPLDTVIGGGGIDTVIATISWQLDNYYASVENLTLAGTNAINGTGNSNHNVIIGNSAANVLSGGDGNDWLSGLGGNDRLVGGHGNDTLDGGTGDDTLIGGRGFDYLIGGAGKDSFQLSRPLVGDFDTIADFSVDDDKILISKAEFGLTQGLGVLDASLFRLGTSAVTASDRFIYNQSTGNLFFDADGFGGNTQVRIAQLSNQADLTNINITVIA
jgi:ELWxxDGT repeat protein